MKNIKELVPKIEAMLFAAGDPVEPDKIAEILDVDIETVTSLMGSLKDSLENRGSGIILIKIDGKYQLCTREEYADEVRQLMEIKKNTPLSNAAFEVLAIIAYNKSVTRSFVEQIRGVDCSGPISSLVQKGLIEEKGRLDLPGRPLIYGTTDRFLRCFSINSLDDLPELPKTEDVEGIAANSSQTSLFDENKDEEKNAILTAIEETNEE